MNQVSYLWVLFFVIAGFFWISWKFRNINFLSIFHDDDPRSILQLLNIKHVAGILLLAVVPVMLYSPVTALKEHTPVTVVDIAVCFFLLILTGLISHRQAKLKRCDSTKKLSQLQLPMGSIILYSIIRGLFLISYEIYFRWLLLFYSFANWGVVMALIINVLIYMLIHAFSGPTEIIGCIPFGLLLCWLSFQFQSPWPAIMMHLMLSFVFEVKLFRYYFHSPKTIMS